MIPIVVELRQKGRWTLIGRFPTFYQNTPADNKCKPALPTHRPAAGKDPVFNTRFEPGKPHSRTMRVSLELRSSNACVGDTRKIEKKSEKEGCTLA